MPHLRATAPLLAALTLGALAFSAPAEAVTIKLATLAPEGSTWHKALLKMGEEWSEATNGEVDLKIYAGGVAGNETVMLRKMRLGQLHAGAMTNVGLLEIDPSSQALNTPMLIQNYEELDYVLDAVDDELEARLAAKEYVVLNWSDIGWTYLFSKDPITAPSDRSKLKVFAWEGDPAGVEMYKKGGFNPVIVSATDVVPSLQSGLIDSFPNTPLASLSLQWFGLAPNMLDVPWAPLLGATVITKAAWDSIPEEHHARLLEISRSNGAKTKSQIRRQDKKAVTVMESYGLKVNKVDADTQAAWETVAKDIHPVMRDKVAGPELFDEVVRLVGEYRAQNP